MEALEDRRVLAADLSGSFVFAPGTFAPGASIGGGMLTIRNLGDTPSEFVPVRVVLSGNGVFGDADDVFLGVFLRDALPSGGESTTPETFVIPVDTAPGSYRLLIALDPDNQIVEDNDNNNLIATAVGSVVVAGAPVFPDLGVTLGPVGGTFLPGQEVTITLTVRNTGNAAADNFVTRIVLSRNNIFGDGDDVSVEEIVEQGLGGILPGETFTETGSIFIPMGVAPGSYFILAKIDANDVVAESNEANNVHRSASASVVIAPPPVVSIIASDPAAGETNNPGRYTLTRTGPTGLALSVNLVFSGTAIAGLDYAPLASIITFAPGQSTVSFALTVIDDMLVEDPETVIVTVAGGTGYTVSATQALATVTITDNEPTISVVATDAVFSETVSNTALLTFTRTGGLNTGPLTVFYSAVPPSNAQAGIDYVPFSGMVTFAAGSATATVTITGIDDNIVEDSKTLVIRITSDPSYRVSASQHTATLTMLDDEPLVTIAATRNGVEGGQSARFTFTRASGSTATALTVNFSYVSAQTTATPGPDFANIPSSVTFAAGQSTVTLDLEIVDDQLAEPTETVTLQLIGSLNYRLGTQIIATVTIADNEPTVSVTAPVATASETPGAPARFTFTRASGSLAGNLTVFYTLSGTASNDGSDFTATPGLFGQITIPDGQASVSITIVPRDDAVAEPSETIIITLNDDHRFRIPAMGAAGRSATVTITDNEPIVSVVATAPTAAEGGATPLRYTFTRTGGPTTAPLTVHFTFAGTATLGQDFASALSVIIPAGQASVMLSISPIDDTLVEPSETVILQLAANAAYRLSTTQASATGTITDNEPTISVVATDPAAGEASVGGQPNTARFTLMRTGPTTGSLTVNYLMLGTAENGTDYQPVSGTVTFAAGSATAVVMITPIDDAAAEPTETVILALGWGLGYRISPTQSSATATITDNEPVVSVIASAPAAAEGGAVGRFTVARTGPTSQALTVHYTLSGSATMSDDYAPIGGTVVIPAGAASAIIIITPIDDQATEPSETVVLTLAAQSHYAIAPVQSAATVTIADNEPTISIRASDAQGREVDGDPVRFIFTRTGPTTQSLTVFYTLGGQATPGLDYAAPSGSIVIPVGALSAELVITPTDDLVGEGSETVVVTLAEGAGYRLPVAVAARSALATVADDEPLVRFTIVSLSAAERNGPLARVTITRSGVNALANAITVGYALTGSATAGEDYVAPPGTITLAAGVATASFEIIGIDDALGESAEMILFQLTPGGGYIVADQVQGQITIQDNEPTVTIAATDPTAGESVGGGGGGRFVITRSGSPAQPLTVTYVVEGTATPGDDYEALSGTIVIPAGQTFVNLDVTVFQDAIGEGPETVIVRLTGNAGYRPVQPAMPATVTIADDEPVISVTAADARATEGPADTARFLFTRTGTVNAPLTVTFALSGSADASDYVSIPLQVTFAAGATTASVTITALVDAIAEVDETVVLTLTGDDGYRPATGTPGSATATIAANGPIVTVAATDPAAAETLAGAPANPGRFTITRTGPFNQPLTVRYHLEGTADASDYASLSGTVIIAAGQASAVVDVSVIDDLVGEAAETFILVLDADPAYRLAANPAQTRATVTIADNEPLVTISAADPTASENGTDTARFLFTRAGPLTAPLTVAYTVSGTATTGLDYTALSGTVIIPAGSATASVILTALPDLVPEPTETVVLTIAAADGYRAGAAASATANILNVASPDLAITDLSVAPQSFSLATPGQMLTISLEYANLGAAAAGAFAIEIRLSADDIFGNADDIVLRIEQVASLAALGNGMLDLSIRMDGISPPAPGAYRIGARIDSQARVVEGDETNNFAFTPAGAVTITL
ncbi:MAG: hypothetical protein JNK35_04115 [Phycisphaerae bacterium]|nr:hypothetical protein [Phycisphaerae bacterium]